MTRRAFSPPEARGTFLDIVAVKPNAPEKRAQRRLGGLGEALFQPLQDGEIAGQNVHGMLAK